MNFRINVYAVPKSDDTPTLTTLMIVDADNVDDAEIFALLKAREIVGRVSYATAEATTLGLAEWVSRIENETFLTHVADDDIVLGFLA